VELEGGSVGVLGIIFDGFVKELVFFGGIVVLL